MRSSTRQMSRWRTPCGGTKAAPLARPTGTTTRTTSSRKTWARLCRTRSTAAPLLKAPLLRAPSPRVSLLTPPCAFCVVAARQCHLSYNHKEAPTPEGADFTECHPWHASACCQTATVVTPEKMKTAYGAGYHWDRCGKLSQACERFFVEEACFYECEVNTGLYRKYTDAQHAACSADGVAVGATVTLDDGSAYNCTVGWGGNDENQWQVHVQP